MLWKLLGWTKLNWKEINKFLSFYNSASNWNYNKILYWINIFKEYFTKILDWYQNSVVQSERYYDWEYCNRVNYYNYIVSKTFNITSVKNIKMNLWA